MSEKLDFKFIVAYGIQNSSIQMSACKKTLMSLRRKALGMSCCCMNVVYCVVDVLKAYSICGSRWLHLRLERVQSKTFKKVTGAVQIFACNFIETKFQEKSISTEIDIACTRIQTFRNPAFVFNGLSAHNCTSNFEKLLKICYSMILK